MTTLGLLGSLLKVAPAGESDQFFTWPVLTFTVALKSRPSARVSDFPGSSVSAVATGRLVRSDLPTSVSLRPPSEPDAV
jgi:hypothetical protein